MNNSKEIEIYINLLEEGTPTLRSAKAVTMHNGLYKILPTNGYDPDIEVWEFMPGEIVRGKKQDTDDGKTVLVAENLFVSRKDILEKYQGYDIEDIVVPLLDNVSKNIVTKAIKLDKSIYKLLPTENFNNEQEEWYFSPGTVVRVIDKDNQFYAFERIREDRIKSHYVQTVMNNKE